MKKPAEYTIKELGDIFAAADVPEEFLAACQQDGRKAVRTVLKRYERQQLERARVLSLYAYEEQAYGKGHSLVAGVDEAGRGPLAGPVSVAAVILPPHLVIERLNDSKKLSEAVREELFDEIKEKAVAVSSVLVDAQTIDRVNIYQATINAMYDAVFGLSPAPEEVLVDAVSLAALPMLTLPIVKGDAKSASIAAASIIAKVTRDRLMKKYDAMYPEYGFAKHKGYGTKEHIEAIRKYGPCPIHRMTFEPLASLFADRR